MGRSVFTVQVIKAPNDISNFAPVSTAVSEGRQGAREISADKAPEGSCCRICYGEHNNPKDPLLSICRCSGSLKFVHHSCLLLWLKYQQTVQKSGTHCSYYWRCFECELCKARYPGKILLYLF